MNYRVVACGSSSVLRSCFRRLTSSGSEGHILFGVLIIGCLSKVSSFSFIDVMKAVTLEVVLSLVKVWQKVCPSMLSQCKFLSKIVKMFIIISFCRHCVFSRQEGAW